MTATVTPEVFVQVERHEMTEMDDTKAGIHDSDSAVNVWDQKKDNIV